MSACCHVTFHRFGGLDVDDIGEEKSFAMLAAEVLKCNAVSLATLKRLCNQIDKPAGLDKDGQERTRLIISSKSAR